MHDTCTRYYKINRRDLVYLKFILEAYEGLSTLSTVDHEMGIVQLLSPSCFASDIAELVNALSCEITIIEVPLPVNTLEGNLHHA